MKRTGLIAAIGAALMGGGPVEINTKGEVQGGMRKKRRKNIRKINSHCRSKYKPHQGVQEKARRLSRMNVIELKQAA